MIRKYRYKPTIFEAVQFDKDNANEVIAFCGKSVSGTAFYNGYIDTIYIDDNHTNSHITLHMYDYVIKDDKGALTRMSESEFDRCFEEADKEEQNDRT